MMYTSTTSTIPTNSRNSDLSYYYSTSGDEFESNNYDDDNNYPDDEGVRVVGNAVRNNPSTVDNDALLAEIARIESELTQTTTFIQHNASTPRKQNSKRLISSTTLLNQSNSDFIALPALKGTSSDDDNSKSDNEQQNYISNPQVQHQPKKMSASPTASKGPSVPLDAATAASIEEIEKEIMRMQQKLQQQNQKTTSPATGTKSPTSSISPSNKPVTNSSVQSQQQQQQMSPRSSGASAVASNTKSATVSALSDAASELRREIEAMEAEILRSGPAHRSPKHKRKSANGKRTSTAPAVAEKSTSSTIASDTASTASTSSNATPLASNSSTIGTRSSAKIPQSISTVHEHSNYGSSGANLNYDERSQIEEEIRRMEEEIRNSTGGKSSSPPRGKPAAGGFNFLQSIESAATEREQRVVDGNYRMQEISSDDDEIMTPQPPARPNLAEMVTKKALERDERLAKEGNVPRMTPVKPKEEYKKVFMNVAMDAANLGRLTRLNEHTVESVATEKAPVEEWKSNGLLAISWNKPNHMSVIHEAAQLGAMTKKQESVVSNYEDTAGVDANGYDVTNTEVDAMWDEYYNSRNGDGSATAYNKLLELDAQAGTGYEKVDTLLMGLKEENCPTAGDNRLLVKPMQYYATTRLEDVQLPKPLPPRIDPARNKEKLIQQQKQMNELLGDSGSYHHRPMTDIGHTVAEIAWERRTRLDRPGSLPRVKERCPCQYCVNPSPYQTYAYKLLEQRLRATGEWHRMKQPLRMDDPRVTRMAQAAQNKYYTPSDIPATLHDFDDDSGYNNNVGEIDTTGKPPEYNKSDSIIPFDEQTKSHHSDEVLLVETDNNMEHYQQQQQHRPVPPSMQDVPMPQPQDAGCCACIIL